MKIEQITNIIKFTILFHAIYEKLESNSLDYIWEKYQLFIGIKPMIELQEISEKALLKKSKWMNRWSYRVIDPRKEPVINYLSEANVNRIDPQTIFSLFRKHIANIEDVNIDHHPVHVIFENFIEEYISKYQRELNLEILV